MITPVVLANIYITLHNCHCFVVVLRTVKTYSLSDFEVYYTISLTIITMLFWKYKT